MRPEDRIASLIGLGSSYKDQMKRTVTAPAAMLDRMIGAFGLDISTLAQAKDTQRRLEALFEGPLPTFSVVPSDRTASVALRAPVRDLLLVLEQGETRRLEPQGLKLELPPLPSGYHAIEPRTGGWRAHVFAAPETCYIPACLQGDANAFGVSAQVYSLRAAGDFGIGDLSHVKQAAIGAARCGASFLGLSPLHTLFPADRSKISPYSPSTRSFIDPIYIDPSALATGNRAAALLRSESVRKRVAILSSERLVDYTAAWALKRELLDAIWLDWKEAPQDERSLDAFIIEQGDRLIAHSTFEALSEHFARQGLMWSGAWPQEFRSRGSSAVTAFAADHVEQLRFHCWLQWLADRQLADAAARARAAGMEIGLYRDLAVGADLYGSELWSSPGAWCADLSVGAPPDPLGPKGQDWGLPPLHPITLAKDGLAAFRALVASNMRHAGAIRIDHAFQLERLFIIPRGEPATAGAYLSYPFEAMKAILRIESHRANCIVIAEDLGNGPQGFSESIMSSGLFSYRVLSFEREADGAFKSPASYPQQSVSCINTHDLPTFLGWWKGLDIDLRECFGVYNSAEWKQEQLGRQVEKAQFTDALEAERVAPEDTANADQMLDGALRYLARTGSALATISFEDVTRQPNQPNLPGLSSGPPNWQRRLDASVEDIMGEGGLLAKTAALFAQEKRGLRFRSHRLATAPPRATYRMQLHKEFTFRDAAHWVPYLKQLGISHLYVSPITTAIPGSMHGYDVIDPTRINPELGGEAGFTTLRQSLDAAGMGLIVDIVPNHMGIGHLNPWWRSVLAQGPASPYARYFDIDWNRHPHGKLVLPVLGEPFNQAVTQNLKLAFDAAEGMFFIAYFDQRFPLSPQEYSALVAPLARRDIHAPPISSQSVHELSQADGPRALETVCRTMRTLVENEPALDAAIGDLLVEWNADPAFLEAIIERQAWRLAYWRTAAADLNYRRFFEINTLAGLRVEDREVFEASHALIFGLVDRGQIQGLRIDHIDGLADPATYLQRLQDRVGPGFFVVVEKILEPGEDLPDWPISGTTGYDALNQLDGAFVRQETRGALQSVYAAISPEYANPEELLPDVKHEILLKSFESELDTVARIGHHIATAHEQWRDLSRSAIRLALASYISALPVYRTYVGQDGASEADRRLVTATLDALALDPLIVDFLQSTLLSDAQGRPRDFREKLQQLTGPVMAKGLEDTLFYRYVPNLSLDEVGGSPETFGFALDEFHRANLERLTRFPGSLVASSTHDTKRGEDTRARLLALAAQPADLERAVHAWMAAVDRTGDILSANDHYMLAQAALGAWPPTADSAASFADRLCEFATKALREAKVGTSWTTPNEAYEAAAHQAVRAALSPGSPFVQSLRDLRDRLDRHGHWISLTRAVLKCTVPGVPDFYQGAEGLDLTLVDPDNRRPIDFAALAQSLISPPRDSKQRIIQSLLQDRQAFPALYAEGTYEPLHVGDAWIAFVRRHQGEVRFVLCRRFFEPAWKSASLPEEAFKDLQLTLPRERLVSLLSPQPARSGTPTGYAALFGGLPAAVLRASNEGG